MPVPRPLILAALATVQAPTETPPFSNWPQFASFAVLLVAAVVFLYKAFREKRNGGDSPLVQVRLELASLTGQMTQLAAQVATHGTIIEGNREAERDARHALANQVQQTVLALEERVREVEQSLAALKGGSS